MARSNSVVNSNFDMQSVSLFDETGFWGVANSNAKEDMQEIEIEKLVPNPNNPYRIDAKEDLILQKSIEENGIMNPLLVRNLDKEKYEVISGHRRLRVAEKLKMKSVPVIVRKCDVNEANILLVDANIRRENIKISEKAKAYALKYAAKKNQGKPGDTLGLMCSEHQESRKTMQRYLAITRLSDYILDLVDSRFLGFVVAVELSYLKPQEISIIEELYQEEPIVIKMEMTTKLKNMSRSKDEPLTKEEIKEVLFAVKQKKEKPKDEIVLRWSDVPSPLREQFHIDKIKEIVRCYLFDIAYQEQESERKEDDE